MRCAYWIKDLSPGAALTSPRTARLRRACPNVPDDPEQRWMCYPHPSGGAMLVYPALDGAAAPLSAFGEPVDTFDGMVFYPPRDAIEPEEAIKSEQLRGPGNWYATTKGKSIWIPLATATPRDVILVAGGGFKYGGYINEYGLLAHEMHDAMHATEGGIAYADARLARLFLLAIQGAYLLTDEMVERCSWWSSRDIAPIAFLIFGLDPKALADAPDGSVSADQTSQTSP